MKCSICGQEAGLDAKFDTRFGSPYQYGFRGKKPTALWMCHECAKSRQSTYRAILWGVAALIVALSLFAVLTR